MDSLEQPHWSLQVQQELNAARHVGDKVRTPYALVGNGHREGPISLLAECGVDKDNRLWKRDYQNGCYVMIADFSGSFGPEELIAELYKRGELDDHGYINISGEEFDRLVNAIRGR